MAQPKSAYEKLLDRLKVKAPALYERLKAGAKQTYRNLKEREASTNFTQNIKPRSALSQDAETLRMREQADLLRLQGGIARTDGFGANPVVGTTKTVNGQLMIFDGNSFKPTKQQGGRETSGPMRTWSNAYGVGGVTSPLTEAEATQQPEPPLAPPEGENTAQAAVTTPTRDLKMNTAQTIAAGKDPLHVWALANAKMIRRNNNQKQLKILEEAEMRGKSDLSIGSSA
tara:strand:- start:1114 stop:1797 length:684 start_codon:yes stop_codon:yes gene_type:complete